MKMTIYRLIRDPKNYHKVTGKETLRVINVHSTFIGIGQDGVINKSEFQKLADNLEPKNEGFSIV